MSRLDLSDPLYPSGPLYPLGSNPSVGMIVHDEVLKSAGDQFTCRVCGRIVDGDHIITVNSYTNEVSCPNGTVSREWFTERYPDRMFHEPGEGQLASVALEEQEEQEDAAFATLVEASTLPNLGALFQAGIKAGVIKPTVHYHN